MLQDGMIALDSDAGKELSFTSDRFDSGSYLWKDGQRIAISVIISKKSGNFRTLAETILSKGLAVHIPTPMGRMEEIVRKAGYRQESQFFEQSGEYVEVWVKESLLTTPTD